MLPGTLGTCQRPLQGEPVPLASPATPPAGVHSAVAARHGEPPPAQDLRLHPEAPASTFRAARGSRLFSPQAPVLLWAGLVV